MSVKNRGFASASKTRRRELSAKGGKKSQQSGKAHHWTKEEASVAGKKGAEGRKFWAAKAAALVLLKKGIEPADLDRLNLSYDEYIYYGGAKSNETRIAELLERISYAN